MKARGAALLKGSAIALIIIGILGLLLYGLMTMLLEMGIIVEHYSKGSEIVLIFALYTVLSIISIITGIYGVSKANDTGYANTCLILGIITLALYCIADIWMSIGQQPTIMHDIYTVITHIVPAFYVTGAYMNKR